MSTSLCEIFMCSMNFANAHNWSHLHNFTLQQITSFLLPSLLLPSLPPHTTADNPDLVPVQPTQTPPIFFDPQSPAPWEFSLNLSVVTPTSQMRPNFTRPVIHGFILQIIVEQNGVNITDNHYMVSLQHIWLLAGVCVYRTELVW